MSSGWATTTPTGRRPALRQDSFPEVSPFWMTGLWQVSGHRHFLGRKCSLRLCIMLRTGRCRWTLASHLFRTAPASWGLLLLNYLRNPGSGVDYICKFWSHYRSPQLRAAATFEGLFTSCRPRSFTSGYRTSHALSQSSRRVQRQFGRTPQRSCSGRNHYSHQALSARSMLHCLIGLSGQPQSDFASRRARVRP